MIPKPAISTNTKLCAVIGNPIGHSLSPAIHNAGYEEMGLDYVYLAFEIKDVKGVLTGMRAMPTFRGMSITIPHKVEAIQYVDEIADVDRHIGSINSVINEGGKLTGFGTDGPAALKAFVDAGVDLRDKRILVIGSGGAARAISFTLAGAAPAGLTLLDINETMLQQLTADLKAGTEANIASDLLTDDSLAAEMATADVIIHCTPIGMHPHDNASIIPAELFRKNQVLFDIVYTPLETKLICEARERGVKVILGVEMFINQAVLQFERFTGVEAPIGVMRKVLLEHLKS